VQVVGVEYRFHEKFVPAFLPHPPNAVVAIHPSGKEHSRAVTTAMQTGKQSIVAKLGSNDNQIGQPLLDLGLSIVSVGVMHHKMGAGFEIISGLLSETPVWIEDQNFHIPSSLQQFEDSFTVIGGKCLRVFIRQKIKKT
jgi:hypothetical protein